MQVTHPYDPAYAEYHRLLLVATVLLLEPLHRQRELGHVGEVR